MKEIRRTDVRFNLSREEDRRAWEFLCSAGGKHNRLIIQAINAYANMENREVREKALLSQIDKSIREAVRESLDNAVLAAPDPTENAQSEPSSQENDDALFTFLDSFQM